MQDWVQCHMSEFILGQTNRDVSNFWVAWIPGWERLWRELKTVRHQGSCMIGHCVPVEVSQKRG